MNIQRKTNRIISVIITLAMIFTVLCVGAVHAGAVSYPSVTLDVPRISQRPNTGDCAIASVATVEAFMYGYPSGDYTSEIYNAVYKANDYSIGANWGQLGYYSVGDFDMQTAYNQLASGYPVIVYRTSAHYSVIYAYVGNSSKLEQSGFMIEDVDDSYSDTTAKKSLTKWVGSYDLGQMVIRRNGLPVPQSKITITCNHPPKYHIKGQTFSVYGNIVSKRTIVSVTMSILDSNGKIANASLFNSSSINNTFNISLGDGMMNFSKLAVGDYTYKITAKDFSGDSVTYSYKFTVVTGSSSIPDTPTVYTSQSTTSQTTKTTSYKAVVKADPCLNMRSGAGSEYQIIDTIPNGTTITVSSQTNEWAKTSYNGHTGWVSLSYITPVTTTTTTTKKTTTTTKKTTTTTKKTTTTTKPASSAQFYVRTKMSTTMRQSATTLSTGMQTVPNNTILSVIEKNGSWFKVKYNGKTGWIINSSCIQNIGDVDLNSKVTSSDALLVLKFVTGSEKLSSAQQLVADLDGNNKINSADALAILNIVIGKYS